MTEILTFKVLNPYVYLYMIMGPKKIPTGGEKFHKSD